MQASATAALWHGSFGTAPGRLVLVKEPGSARPCDLAIFTLDTAASPGAVIERYAWRWPIEPSNAAGKQIMGVGEACNRVAAAVERTVPFAFLVQSLLICWYARYAYDPADVEGAAWLARGTPPRPSPAPPTCSPGSAASSSPPGFLPYGQTRTHPDKSPATPGPATPSRHNSETRVTSDVA